MNVLVIGSRGGRISSPSSRPWGTAGRGQPGLPGSQLAAGAQLQCVASLWDGRRRQRLPGVTFAVLPVSAAQHNPRLAVAGVLLVWPCVCDAAFTFLRRLRHRENVFAAHRAHLYQRLVIAGDNYRTVTRLYSGLAAAGALLAWLWTRAAAGSGLAVVLSLPLLCWGLCRVVWRRERMREP